ncbi:serine hydrolase domain-containing protein [Steroidobacter sp.]|uniref:serine hydrolase domain-containing protein n=1 Tax=Steroidobacter sp. TaxID=1978227 RepID=UPI001A5505C1|nr:serine hydrolase domain-containing protein [Steroidobacter sp.]MBL8268719.1 beta-lactamase family protein [Steroidobacter sp.]
MRVSEWLRAGIAAALSLVAMGDAQASQNTLSQVTPAQVDEVFSKWNRADSPGCAVAVLHDGETVFTRGYGMADLSHDAPIVPSTPFHVASVSKQFTAAAIMLLEEQGKLALDDDVRRYIPELPDFGTGITLRNLLQHTSGLRDQWGLLALAGYRYSLDLITDDDVLKIVLAQRELNFTPGSKFMYSNTGFTLAAQVVKRLSGQSLREFTTRNLFAPLGMNSTHFRNDHAEINRGEAWGYVPAPGGKFRLAVTNFDTVGPTSLYTTVEDLAKWDQNFYEQRVGSAHFNDRMTRLDPLTTGGDNYFAMGLMMLRYRGLPIVEHSGGDAGYRSEILRFPEQHFSVVCLCNTTAPATELARKVADLYLAERLPLPPVTFVVRDDAATRRAALGKDGIYRSRDTGIVMRLDVVDGSLHTIQPSGKTPLRSDGQGHYLVPEALGPARFEPATGKALRVVTQGEGEPSEIWDRLAAYSMPAGALKELTGRYYSDELDVSYSLVERQAQLVLERKKYPPDPLTAIGPDLFLSSQGGTVQFTRAETGTVRGLLVTGARVQNVTFRRQGSSTDAR